MKKKIVYVLLAICCLFGIAHYGGETREPIDFDYQISPINDIPLTEPQAASEYSTFSIHFIDVGTSGRSFGRM